MKVYVDDLLVKSRTLELHLDDLCEAFMVLRQNQMKLNPTKCAFGVCSRKFLSFMLLEWEIEANSEKVEVILCIATSRSISEV